MAQLARTSLKLATGTDFMERIKIENEALDKLHEAAVALAPGQNVGALLRFPRGDGYALYLVTKEKPLTLQWVEFGDNWSIDHATIRGLRLADVTRMVDGERRMRELFRRKA